MHICGGAPKIQKQSWNVHDNKSLPFLNRPKAGMYMKLRKLSAKSWNVVDAHGVTLGPAVRFLLMSFKTFGLSGNLPECY
jgi:hypothetical protein